MDLLDFRVFQVRVVRVELQERVDLVGLLGFRVFQVRVVRVEIRDFLDFLGQVEFQERLEKLE